MAKKYRTVKLEEEIIARLEKLKHPGQTLNGIVKEILEKTENANSSDRPATVNSR